MLLARLDERIALGRAIRVSRMFAFVGMDKQH